MDAAITGWAHTRFGRLEDETTETLIGRVAEEALDHAGLDAGEVDAVFVGTFNEGFSPQGFPSTLASLRVDALRHVPAVRLENACATGSAAIHAALDALAAKRIRTALVIGVEKMTAVSGAEVGDILLKASYVPEEADMEGGFAGMFGRIADLYFQAHGDQRDALALIAAKNHANGAHNPLAHIQKDLGFEFCATTSDKNPIVAGPLRRTDCSLVSDGAAALVITNLDEAWHAPRAVGFRATAHVSDYMPISRREVIAFDGARKAWAQAMEASKLSLDDLSFVETHDCFTIAELIEYEAMGLAEPGQGARVIAEGETAIDGRLPVNPSGGLKAKGHPVGATGVSMHVMAAKQLCGEPAGAHVTDAKTAGIFNMGGTAVANYVSIVERLR
ncbi:MAG: acetyl-CoA acetyltransferase [Roseitalea sp.]|jgi:acetyl-CoA C-acetyltransferase|nr:acetyl-CoA acetyltransferase [Roseitalea sp.]MBO6723596.1 acetyl-CoA acetyltransferase [Roseitalea sp.]MBO6744764.1 acetyl-CoA acetyltransferase [Roseitalea sp.]